MRKPNTLKKRIKSGESCIGTWSIIPSASSANILGASGFDFVIIDMEHGPVSFETAEDMVRALEGEGCTPLIRVPNHDESTILRALEVGAHGVVVPNINTAEQAQHIVSAVKYAPEGNRGMSPFTRTSGYHPAPPKTGGDRTKKENEETMIVLMIEGEVGLKNLDAISEVHGVDVLFIGPYDLSQALGVPGEVNSSLVTKEVEGFVRKVKAAGIASGTLAQNEADIKRWQKAGVQFITYAVDCSIFYNSCANIVEWFNKSKNKNI